MLIRYVRRYSVSTHSRLKAAADIGWDDTKIVDVSTHSRLKAAALASGKSLVIVYSFNTQPPEGGCVSRPILNLPANMFQHTAA